MLDLTTHVLERAKQLSEVQGIAEKDLQQAQGDAQMSAAELAATRDQIRELGMDPDHASNQLNVVAPQSGVILDVGASPGEYSNALAAPAPLCTIADISTVWAVGDIYEKDVAAISEGLPVQIRVGALPNQVFYGRVLHIAPTLDKTSRSIKVRAEIDNHNDQLKDGMYAQVDIHLPAGRSVIVVPLTAVQHNEDSDYVFVAENGKYIKRLIHLGEQKDGNGVVESGLKPGERIVGNGAIYLGIDTGAGG